MNVMRAHGVPDPKGEGYSPIVVDNIFALPSKRLKTTTEKTLILEPRSICRYPLFVDVAQYTSTFVVMPSMQLLAELLPDCELKAAEDACNCCPLDVNACTSSKVIVVEGLKI